MPELNLIVCIDIVPHAATVTIISTNAYAACVSWASF